jgi:hypothetical protein
MVSIADRVAVPPLAGPAVARAPGAAQSAAAALSAAFPPGQRELRLDMFRGLALWLIFIDHVSPDLLTWFTIRNYGFSDAAEIFIFISGYTAAFVYGRVMFKSGFVVGAARILKRVWQIYAAHILLFMFLVAEISYVAVTLDKPFYAKEMEVVEFLRNPGPSMFQALLLRYRPLNMDVLPLYIVMMFFLPVIIRMIQWRANVTLALSVVLYFLTWRYDLHLSAFPDGFWSFNPFAWQLLFVFGAWCALGGVRQPLASRIISSPITLCIAFAYLLAAFGVTMTWYYPELNHMPGWLEHWIYPIDKTDFDVLRFAHFLALAVIAVRLVPAGWSGLTSPWLRPMVLCGQYSLQIFSLGVALAFTGYFILTESAAGFGLHLLVGLAGIAIMSGVAWMFTWYKRVADKNAKTDAAPAPA